MGRIKTIYLDRNGLQDLPELRGLLIRPRTLRCTQCESINIIRKERGKKVIFDCPDSGFHYEKWRYVL